MLGSVVLSGISLGRIRSDCADNAVQTFIAVNIGLAIVHGLVPFYIQSRIASFLQEKYSGADADSINGRSEAKDMAEAAKHIFWRDIIFCLYFLIAPCIFGFNWWGIWELGSCSGTTPAWCAAAIMIGYGFVAFWYYVCWFCGQCCFAQTSKVRAKVKVGTAKVPPTTVVEAV